MSLGTYLISASFATYILVCDINLNMTYYRAAFRIQKPVADIRKSMD